MNEKQFRKKKFWCTVVAIAFTLSLVVFFSILFTKWMRDGEEKQFQDALLNVKANFLNNHQKMHYSIDTYGHTVNIKLWQEGLTDVSKQAYNNNNEAWDAWDDIKSSMSDLAHSLYKEFILVDDAVVYLHIVNENNTDRDLLVYKNKYMCYDVVTGIGG